MDAIKIIKENTENRKFVERELLKDTPSPYQQEQLKKMLLNDQLLFVEARYLFNEKKVMIHLDGKQVEGIICDVNESSGDKKKLLFTIDNDEWGTAVFEETDFELINN